MKINEDLNNFEPDTNTELYSDIAFQMLSAYIQGDTGMGNALFSNLSDSEDELLLPGIIYGCIIHMGILLSTLSEATSSSMKQVFQLYAQTYNSEIRTKLSEMPALYPKFANAMLDDINNKLEKGEQL
jgi:hypothetical protein